LCPLSSPWDDAAIVAPLTTVKGIGVWTAEMFLIFSLCLQIRIAVKSAIWHGSKTPVFG